MMVRWPYLLKASFVYNTCSFLSWLPSVQSSWNISPLDSPQVCPKLMLQWSRSTGQPPPLSQADAALIEKPAIAGHSPSWYCSYRIVEPTKLVLQWSWNLPPLDSSLFCSKQMLHWSRSTGQSTLVLQWSRSLPSHTTVLASIVLNAVMSNYN